MTDNSTRQTNRIRYRSFAMIYGVIISLMMLGVGLFLLISIILGNMESEPFAALFSVVFMGIAIFMALTNAMAVETSHDGLKVKYLFKAKHIPWQEIYGMCIRLGSPNWCEIKYAKLPIRRAVFFLDYLWWRRPSRSNLLLSSIVSNADLKPVDQNFWGLPIYKREEAING